MSAAGGSEPVANGTNIALVRMYVERDIGRFQAALKNPRYADQRAQFSKSLEQSQKILHQLSNIQVDLEKTGGQLSDSRRRAYSKVVAFVAKTHPNLTRRMTTEPWSAGDPDFEAGSRLAASTEGSGVREGEAAPAAVGAPGALRSTLESLAGMDDAQEGSLTVTPAPGLPLGADLSGVGAVGARGVGLPGAAVAVDAAAASASAPAPALAALSALPDRPIDFRSAASQGRQGAQGVQAAQLMQPGLPGSSGPSGQPVPVASAAAISAPIAAAGPAAPPLPQPDPKLLADLSAALSAASSARAEADAAKLRAQDLSSRLDAALQENARLAAALEAEREQAAQAQSAARNHQLMYRAVLQERDLAVRELLEARESQNAGEHVRELVAQVEQLTAMVQESYRNELVEISEDVGRKISASLAQYEELFKKLKKRPQRNGTVSSISPRSIMASGVSDLGASALGDDAAERGTRGFTESSFVGAEPLPAPVPEAPPSVRSISTGRQSLGKAVAASQPQAPPQPQARPAGRGTDALVSEVVRIITGLGPRAPALQRVSQREWSVEKNGHVLRLGFGEDGTVVIENEGMAPLEGYLRALSSGGRVRSSSGRSRSGASRGGLSASKSFTARSELGSSQFGKLSRSAMSTVSQGSYVSAGGSTTPGRRNAQAAGGKAYAPGPGKVSVSAVAGMGPSGGRGLGAGTSTYSAYSTHSGYSGYQDYSGRPGNASSAAGPGRQGRQGYARHAGEAGSAGFSGAAGSSGASAASGYPAYSRAPGY